MRIPGRYVFSLIAIGCGASPSSPSPRSVPSAASATPSSVVHRAIQVQEFRLKIVGNASKALVEGRLHRALLPMRRCYQVALKSDPEATAHVVFKFEFISGAGALARFKKDETRLPNDAMGKCLLEVIEDIRFDPPISGGMVQVEYGVEFVTSD
jgi:hypothetical protein